MIGHFRVIQGHFFKAKILKKNRVNLKHLNLRRCSFKSHYFTSLLFYSTFISITKPRLLIVPLSTPRSSLSDSSSLRIEFNMSFDWSWYWSVSPRMIGNDWKRCFFPQFRYVCWEVFIAANSRKIKVGANCFRTFRVNLMYVNLTFKKFALILCNVNFLRVVKVHR